VDRQTDFTDRHTDAWIAILHTLPGDELIMIRLICYHIVDNFYLKTSKNNVKKCCMAKSLCYTLHYVGCLLSSV